MKTNDQDWVEDVRRWYFNGGRAASAAVPQGVLPQAESHLSEIGYEAANPSLQSSGWQASATGFGSLA